MATFKLMMDQDEDELLTLCGASLPPPPPLLLLWVMLGSAVGGSIDGLPDVGRLIGGPAS